MQCSCFFCLHLDVFSDHCIHFPSSAVPASLPLLQSLSIAPAYTSVIPTPASLPLHFSPEHAPSTPRPVPDSGLDARSYSAARFATPTDFNRSCRAQHPSEAGPLFLFPHHPGGSRTDSQSPFSAACPISPNPHFPLPKARPAECPQAAICSLFVLD